ncbi:MAG: hypothetical protein ACKESB_02935 [Candidatus Hodgkinia cicadicola]
MVVALAAKQVRRLQTNRGKVGRWDRRERRRRRPLRLCKLVSGWRQTCWAEAVRRSRKCE